MWIVRLALRRPFTVAAFCLVILLLGVLSAAGMPVDIFPAIDIPVVVMVWSYPGLSAEDMERRVTFISERGLSTSVSGISKIESQSLTGIAVMRVYFEPGSDIGGAIAQITSASLSAARVMPPGIQPPVLLRFNASNVPVAQLTVSGQKSEQELFDWGLNFLRLRLFTIPGLATPAPYGGKQRQIQIDVDPHRAAAKGLSPQDVVNAVLSQNVTLPAGSARIGKTEYDVEINGSPDTSQAFNAIPVRVVNGATVYLGDVAHVYDGFAEQSNIVRVNGKRATYLQILKKENASTLAVIDATKDLLPSIKAAAPQGIELKLDFDQSVFVRAAVSGVLREAIIAAALVALMILVFVGSWRSTLIVCISIPLSPLVGVIGLKLSGQTFNLMTLGGLSLAIGMLVDDATVEVENINRNRGLGKPLLRAILDGARQIALPALAATVTICIVFFPVVLLTGPAKFLFIPLALSVVFSMSASYLLSRTLVPTLAAILLKNEEPEALEDEPHDRQRSYRNGSGEAKRLADRKPRSAAGRFLARLDDRRRHAFERLRNCYGRAIEATMTARVVVLIAAALFVVASGILFLTVGLDFFPAVDAGVTRLQLRAPSGTRIEETERIVDAVERRIRTIIPAGELATIDDNIGLPVFYNLGFVPSDNVAGSDAEILISFARHHRPTPEYVRKIRAAIHDDFPGTTAYFVQADLVSEVLNFGLPAPIDVQVESRDNAVAVPLALRLQRALRGIPGTEDVRIAQVLDYPTLRLDVDRARAAQLGLTERDVASSLLTSLASSSLVAPNFWVNPDNKVNYFVVVQTPLFQMRDVDDIMTTPITASASTPVLANPASFATAYAPPPAATPAPLVTPVAAKVSDVARITPGVIPANISHATVQPVIDVECNVEGRDLGAVAGDIDDAVKAMGKLPPGTAIHVRGQSETMFTSFKKLALGMLVAIALVYLLLVTLFQSWIDPLIILFAVPGALSGVLWMLTVTSTTLNVESFMGSIMAIGIATSNSILLVNFANDRRIEDERVSPIEAAIAAGRTRLRPVLMTALAMILGMLPMAIGLGEGGEQNAPLGRAVIGGLLIATPVTLFVVPLAYSVFRKKQPTRGQKDREVAKADAHCEAHEARVRMEKEAEA